MLNNTDCATASLETTSWGQGRKDAYKIRPDPSYQRVALWQEERHATIRRRAKKGGKTEGGCALIVKWRLLTCLNAGLPTGGTVWEGWGNLQEVDVFVRQWW